MSVFEYYDEEEEIGFRFHPSDQELILCYLQPKVAKIPNKEFELEDKTDIYAKEPWRLIHTENDFFEPNEWFYFMKRNQSSGKQTSRRVKGETCQGCWKTTGKLKDVESEETGAVIGKKRALSFYVNGDSKASGWTMKEYYLHDGDSFQNQVLCHLKGP